MNVTFSRNGLRKAVAIAASAVPSRSPREVLKWLLMSSGGKDATVTGTSLEVTMCATVGGLIPGSSLGSVLVQADKLNAILSEASSDEITISHEQKDAKVIVKAGKSTDWKLGY